MGSINVSSVKEGMVLAEDLFGPRGQFLLGKGTSITSKHIMVMKTWGVVEAVVEGVTREEVAARAAREIDPEVMERSARSVDGLFSRTNLDHEAMEELKRVCLFRTAALLSDGVELPDPERGLDMVQESEPAKGGRRKQMSASELVNRHVQLVSFPDIYFRIVEVLNDPLSSASHLAEVVGKDPSLSAKLLRLVNSPFYGFPSKIESIARAISLIGAKDLTTLAIGVSVISYFRDIPRSLMDVKAFWKHSITCGCVARILAARKVGLTEERFFIAGLIHDIGRLLIIKGMTGAFKEALLHSVREGIPLYEAEKEILGFDHAMVGGLLLKNWRLPPTLERPIRFHHRPGNAINTLEPSIIHVADILAIAMQFGAGGSRFVPPVDEQAWDILCVSPSALGSVVSQADRQVSEIQRVFLGEGE